MNLCVLGGSGFVGTELVTRLVHAGHWVRVPTRNLGRVERLRVLETAELRVANVHEPQILEPAVRRLRRRRQSHRHPEQQRSRELRRGARAAHRDACWPPRAPPACAACCT